MENQLLLSGGVILDIVFFVLLVLGLLFGVSRGFVRSICKWAGTLFAVVFALVFCVSFANWLEGAFGMTSAIAKGLTNTFSDPAYTTPIGTSVSGAEIGSTLESMGVSWFWVWIIGLGFGGVEVIPIGTTAAMMIGSVLAKWIAIAISFVLLGLLIKIGAAIIGRVLTGVIDRVPVMRTVNKVLGGILGLAQMLLLIFVLLALCSWLPLGAVHEFLSSSTVVGGIYNSEWFAQATSYAVSGQWFLGFIN